MQQPLRPEPDPSKPLTSATGVLRLHPDDANFEADFADLAARFAQSGGGLSPALSADLALEIVLNEIVEQACLATGATGAAIVLQRDGELVCRASNGATAPELGSRLDTVSGLSGECLRTHRTQRCDDVLSDPRADIAASQRLGVRSVMVMPLLRGEELVGVFELFSSRPFAFGDRDEGTLEILADRALSNLERAVHPPTPEVPPPPIAEPIVEQETMANYETVANHETIANQEPAADPSPLVPFPDILSESPEPRPPRYDFATTLLAVAVVLCAVLLGILLGRHWGPRRVAARSRAVPVNAVSQAPATTTPPATAHAPTKDAKIPAPASSAPRPSADAAVPPGGLLVYENGKEVFRLSPTRNQGESVQRASSVVKLSPAAAAGSLVKRVEPEYPEQARQQQIQGAVVLDVHIATDGAVQDVQLVSGPPELAQASTDAVKQWRFKPRSVNGHPVEMQTRVTLNFRLPQ